MVEIKFAQTDEQILACYPVMKELRPNINTGEEFLERVKRQQVNCMYNLACLEENGSVKACVTVSLMI